MIIITGASKGIGRFLFLKFKEFGIPVLGTYNTTTKNLENDIESYFMVDISNYIAVENWISKIKDSLQNIILLNCAGISYNAFAHKSEIDKWHRVIEVNLLGTFNVIRSVLPIMRNQNYGRIINFSSVVTSLPTPGVSAYAASKAGLIGLTKSLAIENANKGITVNTLNLGYVNLGMGIKEVPQDFLEKVKTKIPVGRLCYPEEVYTAVNFLIHTEYVNGATIDINGALI